VIPFIFFYIANHCHLQKYLVPEAIFYQVVLFLLP
jgi:hypothetical protein